MTDLALQVSPDEELGEYLIIKADSISCRELIGVCYLLDIIKKEEGKR